MVVMVCRWSIADRFVVFGDIGDNKFAWPLAIIIFSYLYLFLLRRIVQTLDRHAGQTALIPVILLLPSLIPGALSHHHWAEEIYLFSLVFSQTGLDV